MWYNEIEDRKKGVMVMLAHFEPRSIVVNDPDPYRACHHEITEHPHYRDCDNCDHAKYATCVYGRIRVRELWFDAIHNEASRKILGEMGIDSHEPLAPQFCE